MVLGELQDPVQEAMVAEAVAVAVAVMAVRAEAVVVLPETVGRQTEHQMERILIWDRVAVVQIVIPMLVAVAL